MRLLKYLPWVLIASFAYGADEAPLIDPNSLPADAKLSDPVAEAPAPLQAGTENPAEPPNPNEIIEPALGEPIDDQANSSPDNVATQIPKSNETEQAAPPIPRVNPNPAQRRISEVLNHLELFQRGEEVIKFGDDDSTLSGLYLPENTGTPQGGVLILHDIAQHPQWPQTVGPLREYLPDYGWNTLSLFFKGYLQEPLPVIPPPLVEEASPAVIEEPLAQVPEEAVEIEDIDETDTPTEEVTTEAIDQNFVDEPSDTLAEIASDLPELPVLDENISAEEIIEEEIVSVEDEFLNTMQLRVEDGLRQLNTLGQFNLVIVAHGLSANWAVATLNERFKNNPGVLGYALILINAKTSAYPKYNLNENLATLKIPMLDIVTGLSKSDKRFAKSRRDAITRSQNKKYLQIQMPKLRTNIKGKSNLITRRVRGWLKTHAAGEEVDVVTR